MIVKPYLLIRFIGNVGDMNGGDLTVSSGQWTPDLVKLPVQATAAPA